MRHIIALCVFLIVRTLAQTNFYDPRYNYFDVDSLIQNTRLLKKYADCFLDNGPCTPVGRVFKQVLPEVIQSRCSKCTLPQKRFVRKAFDAFKQYLPEKHAELKKRFDPQNKYYDKFEKAVASA